MVDQVSPQYDFQTVLDFYNSQEWSLATYIHPEKQLKRKMLTLDQLLKKVGKERDVIMDEYAWKILNDEQAHLRLIAKMTHILNQNNKRKRKQVQNLTTNQKLELNEQSRKRWHESGKISQDIKKQEDPEAFREKKNEQWNNWYHNLSQTELEQRREQNRQRMNNKRQKN